MCGGGGGEGESVTLGCDVFTVCDSVSSLVLSDLGVTGLRHIKRVFQATLFGECHNKEFMVYCRDSL